jgi:hypothetical protein
VKRNHRSPSHPRVRKQVHFNTLPEHSDIIVSDLTLFEISPRENRPMQRIPASSNTPHIPGSKFIRPYTGGRLELLKAVGTYKPPGSPLADRPRCKLLKNFDCCSICLRPPKQSNLWLPDTPRKGFFTSTPLPRRSTNLPYFT